MAAEAPAVDAKPRPGACSSRSCRAVTAAAVLGSGFWVFGGVHRDRAARPWKAASPWNRFRLGLSICLIAWGMTNLMTLPLRK